LYLPTEVYDEILAGQMAGFTFYDGIEQHIPRRPCGTVLNLRCLLRTVRIEGIKIGQVWVGSTALVGGHTRVLGVSLLHVTS
jgi:hypothetical protein